MKPAATSPIKLIALLAVPTALIVAVSFVAIFRILDVSSAEIATTSRDGQRRLAWAVMTGARSQLNNTVRDYAYWDDLYDQARGRLSEAFVQDYLDYALGAFDLSHVVVLDGENQLFHQSVAGGHDALGSAPGDIEKLSHFADSARRLAVPSQTVAVDGFVFMGGYPYLAAAALIQPASPARAFEPRGHVLMFVRQLESVARGPGAPPSVDRSLNDMAANFGLANLRMVPGLRPEVEAPSLPFLDRTAGEDVTLLWDAPADAALSRDTLASILAVFVFAAGAFGAAVFGWTLIIGKLRRAEAAAIAAEEASAAKSAFIANMSHELRTPLNAIIGFSDVMAHETFGPHAKPAYKIYAADIHRAGGHLLSLINDLLSYSKIEAGEEHFRLEPCAAAAIVAEACQTCSVLADAKSIRLSQRIVGETPICMADRRALLQVLLNILGNAIKFTDEGGLVEIVMRRVGPFAEFVVRDTGCGMPPEFLRQLGRPFAQVENVYARRHGGTGLGVAIAISMVEAMGGEIRYESVPGEGTDVTIRLPGAAPLDRAA